jgi:hypothetical protein
MKFLQPKWMALILLACVVLGLVTGSLLTSLSSLDGQASRAEAAQALASGPVKIAYLTSGEVPEIEGAAQVQNVAVLREAPAVALVDASNPLQAFVFDGSLKSQLNVQWLRERYAEGLVVAGVNVSIQDLAALVGDPNAITGPWANAQPPTQTDFYSLLCFALSGDPAEVNRYKREAHRLLDADGNAVLDNVVGKLSVLRCKAQVELPDSQSKETLFSSIRHDVDNVKNTQGTDQP